jgi:Tfp pilus assembly protein PilX
MFRQLKTESGIVLITVLLMVMVMMIMAVGILSQSMTEVKVLEDIIHQKQARKLAEEAYWRVYYENVIMNTSYIRTVPDPGGIPYTVNIIIIPGGNATITVDYPQI